MHQEGSNSIEQLNILQGNRRCCFDAVVEEVEHRIEGHIGEEGTLVEGILVEDNLVGGTLVEGKHLLDTLLEDNLGVEVHQRVVVAGCNNSYPF